MEDGDEFMALGFSMTRVFDTDFKNMLDHIRTNRTFELVYRRGQYNYTYIRARFLLSTDNDTKENNDTQRKADTADQKYVVVEKMVRLPPNEEGCRRIPPIDAWIVAMSRNYICDPLAPCGEPQTFQLLLSYSFCYEGHDDYEDVYVRFRVLNTTRYIVATGGNKIEIKELNANLYQGAYFTTHAVNAVGRRYTIQSHKYHLYMFEKKDEIGMQRRIKHWGGYDSFFQLFDAQ